MRVPIPDELQLPNTIYIKQLSKKEILFKVMFLALNFFLIKKKSCFIDQYAQKKNKKINA